MALELTIQTSAAQKAIEQIDASMEKLQQTFAQPLNVAGLERASAALSKLGASISTSGLASLERLGRALDSFARASNIGNIAIELDRLSRINVAAVATSVERLSSAMSRLVVPPGLAQAAGALNALATAANSAVPAMTRLQATMASFRPGTSIEQATGQLNRLEAAGTRTGRSLSTAFGAVIGLAIGRALFGFGRGVISMVESLDQFNNRVSVTEHSTAMAAEQLALVDRVATQTAYSITGLRASFAGFNAASRETFSRGESNQMFAQLATAARASGLSLNALQGVFSGLTTSMNTGKLSIDGLVQAFSAVLPVNRIVQETFGVTTQELEKQLQSGERLASSTLPRLVEALTMAATSSGQFQRQMGSLSALWGQLTNAMQPAMQAFAEGFQVAGPPLQDLIAGLQSDAFKNFAYIAGVLIGGALRLLVDGFKAIGATVNFVIEVVSGLYNGIKSLIDLIVSGWANAFNDAKSVATTFGSVVTGIFDRIGDAIRGAIDWVRSLISMFREAIGLGGQAGNMGGGGGGGSDTASDATTYSGEFRQGGFSSSPVSRQAVPMSAFIGAKHFADGGVTGGGIPSILHDNEAVVPLSGGRSIPVSLGGSIGKLWTTMKEGNQLVAEMSQRLINLGVVFKTEMDVHKGILQSILDTLTVTLMAGIQKICDELYKVTQAVGSIRMSGGGGYGGGGGPIPVPDALSRISWDNLSYGEQQAIWAANLGDSFAVRQFLGMAKPSKAMYGGERSHYSGSWATGQTIRRHLSGLHGAVALRLRHRHAQRLQRRLPRNRSQ